MRLGFSTGRAFCTMIIYAILLPHLSLHHQERPAGSNYSAHAGVSTLMGYLEDRSHLKNQYGTGTMWRPGSACQPPRQTMFATPNKTFMARPNAAFSMGWRERLQAQRAKKYRDAANAIRTNEDQIDRKITRQEFVCLNRNHASHAMVARDRLNWQRHLSTGQQRHEQHRFDSELARNAIKRPSDQLVETRNPPTMVVAGRLDGLGCEWFAPRPDPKPPLPLPPEPPFAPMMTSMSPPMGRLRRGRSSFSYETANQRLNHGVDDC